MSERPKAGRVFSAIAFMVIGACAVTLLPDDGPSSGTARASAAGPVDIGFSQDMIVHHQQAVTMAQTAGGRVSPPVAQVATAIQLDQLKEIGQLQGWLALWNAPQVPSGAPMSWMGTGGSGHGSHATGRDAGGAMPGMASIQEMQRLGDATGKEADAWFLKLMIRHHEGGLVMARAAARKATHPQVRSLAALMAGEQREETATMSGLLSALGQRPLPSPASPG